MLLKPASYRYRIQNQNYAAIAELRRAADPGDARQWIVHRSYHDLGLAKHAIDGDAHGLLTFTDDERMKGFLVALF